MNKHKARLKFLIYPNFQLTLITINTAVLSCIALAVGYQTYRAYSGLHALGLEAKLPDGHAYYRFLEFQSHALYEQIGLGFVVATVLSLVFTMIVSHRMAGPLIRLRRHFEDMAETGEIKPLSFRKGDFFSDLPATINRGLEASKKKDAA